VKILMTGFEPFCGERINPSAELLKIFSAQDGIETLLLPVSYERSTRILLEKVSSERYDFILMLGQAGGRKHICLERVAINCMDADKADEDGKVMLETAIQEKGPTAFLSELPLRQWFTSLRAKGFNIEISNTAGAFVCNHLYYRMFAQVSSPADPDILFLHVPYLTEQLMGKPQETFGMSLQCMKQTVSAVLEEIENHLVQRN
jgi:pyroglutamyl-peptidase